MRNARSVSRRARSKFQPKQIARHNPGRAGLKLLFVCRLNAKRPLGFPAGAIPTVDFLLAHPATNVKKMGVKTHDRSHSKISADQIASRAGPTGPELLLVCRLNTKGPRGFPAGAIPTVDFLLA
jgi:hypothetical protein